MFPPYVRDGDAALIYLLTWCDIIGGELLDGIDWEEITDRSGRVAILRVRPFRVAFRVGTTLTVAMDMDPNSLRPSFYRFDLRQGSELCFRHDFQVGHEELGTGPYHLHVGPGQDDRRPDTPQTLQTVFEHVTAENLHRSWEGPR